MSQTLTGISTTSPGSFSSYSAAPEHFDLADESAAPQMVHAVAGQLRSFCAEVIHMERVRCAEFPLLLFDALH